MKKLLFLSLIAALCAAGSVQAAVINWQAPVAIADGTDVSLEGILVEAVNACGSEIGLAGFTENPVVNGVQFMADSTKLDRDHSTSDFYVGGSGDAYDELLSTVDFGDEAVTGNDLFTVAPGLLEVGKNYLFQIWYVDDRAAKYAVRNQQYAGINDASVQSGQLNAGTGMYVIGYFAADGTSQEIWRTTGDSDPHVTAYQVREVPEPATMVLLGLGSLLGLRRKK